jgi:hypothetical protein
MEDTQVGNVGTDNSQPAPSVEQTNPAPAAVVAEPMQESGTKAVPATNPTSSAPAAQAGQSPVPPLDKNYQELRAWSTRVAQDNATSRKQIEALTAQIKQMTDLITKATEKPYDPDQFMEEFRNQGPEFLKKHLEAGWKEKESALMQQIEAAKAAIVGLRIDSAVRSLRADTAGHPDFAKLEPEMQKLLDSGVIPQSEIQSKPENELLEQLYQMAKLQHSQDAIKAAEANGRKAAETELAREARSGVAGGGRVTPNQVLNPENMTLAQYREFCAKAGIVKEF